jgi:hypothetical protein
MRRFLFPAAMLVLAHCGSDSSTSRINVHDGGGGASGGGRDASVNGAAGGRSNDASGSGGEPTGAGGSGYRDAFDPNDSPPKIGEPGCGFPTAAFCDTFGSPATIRGRGGELDALFWSAGRMFSQVSTTRAMGIGMAVIPECRPDVSNHVWPDGDTLICNPTADVASGHLLVATAAQYYGQNGYRIRQPFDFAGRPGKIVFDASADPLGPLFGWISLAITEDPISLPGYSIQSNDEGSIIPKNALEVHFANAGGDALIAARNVHVFNNYVDTVYAAPASAQPAARKQGKLNHFEFLVSESQVQVSVTPYSDDGVKFGAPTFVYTQPIKLPFSRGYVHLSLHNHATLKYTQPSATPQYGIVDASVARIDNVGFDGPVVSNWREYEVPDALVKFNEPNFEPLQDPYNPDNAGVDIGYVVQDTAKGPKQTLHFKGVDLSGVATATLALSFWVDFLTQNGSANQFTLRARVNGNQWHDRVLTAEEAAFFGTGPTTLDSTGQPMGHPGTQGRLALMIDVPLGELVAGDNTVEFVTANVPTSYPPLVCNIDLVMRTN